MAVTSRQDEPEPWQTGAMGFESVYQRFKTPVWRLALRMSPDRDEALDACQEIFLRVWRGLPGFRRRSTLSTWVFQIAWNVLRTRARQRQLQAGRIGRPAGPKTVGRFSDPATDPERCAAAGELVERVDRCLAQLPELQRAALWLREGEGMRYEEIARILDVPVGTVRSRISRARAALSRLMEAP